MSGDGARISDIRAMHFQDSDDPSSCYECGFGWPCDSAFLLTRLAAAEAAGTDSAGTLSTADASAHPIQMH